jgi:Zn-dependent protease
MTSRPGTAFRLRLLEIEVAVEHRLLGMLVLAVAFHAAATGSPLRTLHLALGLLAALLAVLAHELAHAAAARRLGLQVGGVRLRALGGVAAIEPPRTPREEALVAAAGPAANLVLAGTGLLILGGRPLPPYEGMPGPESVFTLANLLLGAGNLLPAYPMDGGRLLRALLARWTGAEAATRVARAASRVQALVLLFLPLLEPGFGLLYAGPLLGLLILVHLAGEARREELASEGARALARAGDATAQEGRAADSGSNPWSRTSRE